MGAGSMTERQARAHAYENPRPEVAALVPTGARRILDLGCASGALGAALKARQACEVVGVEADPGYARDAATRLDHVVLGDVAGAEADGTFDCLIAADVLEHLAEPEAALARWAARLEPGGTAVVSLPNARHWELFWEVFVRGTFPRRSAGIFDRTHLRWFTLADAYGLCSAAGLEVVEVRRTVRPGAPAWTAAVRGVRAFGAFQHVIAARRC